MFGIPYLISAGTSPFIGFFIDKIGKRGLIISCSSLVLIAAFTTSLLLPATQGSKIETVPLVLLGVGYSIYCSVIWSSIPYTVSPQTVGTAFGICTAIQNMGLVIAPTVVGYLKTNTERMFGYFWVMIFFICINIVGLGCNTYLYYIDRKYFDSVLHVVNKGEKLTDLIKSPNNSTHQ